MMPKWNGLEVPKLPRGVFIRTMSNTVRGFQICANTEQFTDTHTNLVDVCKKNGKLWEVLLWDVEGVTWKGHTEVDTLQEALDYAVAMLWLGEVKYTLDEGRVDVRYED
jgi:hypothetical protein